MLLILSGPKPVSYCANDFVSIQQISVEENYARELRKSTSKVVSIFGSSRPNEDSAELSGSIVARVETCDCGVVSMYWRLRRHNGGGFKGATQSNEGAPADSNHIIGVTSAVFSPTPNQYVNTQFHTMTLYERLRKLIDLGDGYIVLKGGTGTLVEFALVWELMNKSMIPEKPIIVVTDFWRPVVELLSAELAFEGLESCTKYVRIARDSSAAADMMIGALLDQSS